MTLFRNFFSCVRGNRSHRHRQVRTTSQTKIKLGVPLSKLCSDSHLPRPLLKLVTFLAREGAKANDLFRRPGNMTQVMSIIKLLSQGKTVQWTSYNLYTAANVAKKFLLSIPGGLFGRRGEECLLGTAEMSEEDRIEEFLRIIREMDNASRELTIILFGILFRMVAHAAANTTISSTHHHYTATSPTPSPTQISIESFASSTTSTVHSVLSEAVAKSVAGSLFHTCRDSPNKVERAVPILQSLILSFPSFDVGFIDYFDQMVNKLSLSNSSTGSSHELSYSGSMKIVRKPSGLAASLEAWTESFGKGQQQSQQTGMPNPVTTTTAAVVAALVASSSTNGGGGGNGHRGSFSRSTNGGGNGNGNRSSLSRSNTNNGGGGGNNNGHRSSLSRSNTNNGGGGSVKGHRSSLSRNNTIKNRPSYYYPYPAQYSYQLPYNIGMIIPSITITNPYGDIEFGYHPNNQHSSQSVTDPQQDPVQNSKPVQQTNPKSSLTNNQAQPTKIRHPIDRLQSMKRRQQANLQRRSDWFLADPKLPALPPMYHNQPLMSIQTPASTSDLPSATSMQTRDVTAGLSISTTYLTTSLDDTIVTTASCDDDGGIHSSSMDTVVMVTCGGSSICLGQLDAPTIMCTAGSEYEYHHTDTISRCGPMTTPCCCITVSNSAVMQASVAAGLDRFTEDDLNSVCRCRPTVAVASLCCSVVGSHHHHFHQYHHHYPIDVEDDDDDDDGIQDGDIIQADDGMSYVVSVLGHGHPEEIVFAPASPVVTSTVVVTSPSYGIAGSNNNNGNGRRATVTPVVTTTVITDSNTNTSGNDAPSSVPLIRRMIPSRSSVTSRTDQIGSKDVYARSTETSAFMYDDRRVVLHIDDDDDDDDDDDQTEHLDDVDDTQSNIY